MLRMLNINSIYNTLLVVGKPLERLKQSFDARSHIQRLMHLLHQEISISPSFFQRVDESLLITLRQYRVVVKCRQPPFGNKPLDAPRLHHHLKQVRESLSRQSLRRSRQSHELRLRPSLPHHLVRLCQCMMCLIHDHQSRLPLHLLNIPRQPLNRVYLY